MEMSWPRILKMTLQQHGNNVRQELGHSIRSATAITMSHDTLVALLLLIGVHSSRADRPLEIPELDSGSF